MTTNGSFLYLPEESKELHIADAVTGMITQHPVSEEEILQTGEHWTPGQFKGALVGLSESGKAKVIFRHGKRFWSFTGAKYA